jgi:hypothetical protein
VLDAVDDTDNCDGVVAAGTGVAGMLAAKTENGIIIAQRLIHHRFRKWYLLFKNSATSGLNRAAGIRKNTEAHVAVRPIKAHSRKKIDKIHNAFFPFKAITSFI